VVEGAGLENGLSVLFKALNVDPRAELGDPETEQVHNLCIYTHTLHVFNLTLSLAKHS
jgi:hypothetical protein